nr:alkaline phosphatase, tissue-nonspecific isozyme-like [Procambarus clarkii]
MTTSSLHPLMLLLLTACLTAGVSGRLTGLKTTKTRTVYPGQDHLGVTGRGQHKPIPRGVVEDSAYWKQQMQAELQAQLEKEPIVRQAKNVILFLGDGTSISTLTAARLLKGQRSGNFEHEVMAYEKFPYSALIKTYSADKVVTDSAASATAYLSGVKTNQEIIGVDANVLLGDCDAMNVQDFHTRSILEDFQDAGRSTGIVTVTRVTHASPAGAFAHTAERHWESDTDVYYDYVDTELCDDIAEQLVLGDSGSKIKVILGGGRQKLTPQAREDPEGGKSGKRRDGKDLIQTWLDHKALLGNASYVWNRDDLLAVDTGSTDYLMGKLIVLQRRINDQCYLLTLCVEGGNIDLAHHLNQHRSALEEALEFEKAIELAVSMTDPQDTLIVVTADHSQPMVINGYQERGSDVLGLGDYSDVDGLAFTTLLYTNGPGYRTQVDGARPDPALEDYSAPHYVAAATVPMEQSNHAGEDVALYAMGPHAHLFTGIHENAFIPHALRYAACVGEGLQFCSSSLEE